MKFTHLADSHIGGWRHPVMKKLNNDSFKYAINFSIKNKVDFVLISGDLFNTAFPDIDSLKVVFRVLKNCKDKKIPIYIIPGSHDYSATGKTMLEILEISGLVINVFKGNVDENQKLNLEFTKDVQTNTLITGLPGKKGTLEKQFFVDLNRELIEKKTNEQFKIFMFHTAITQLKPKELEMMDSAPMSYLPKNFDYYAGGHVHTQCEAETEEKGKIIYPGPVFPNNFKEIEKLEKGSFYYYDEGDGKFISIDTHETYKIILDCTGFTPLEIENELDEEIKDKDLKNKIVITRLFGEIKEGKTTDINYQEITKMMYDKGALFVMKNTAKLTSVKDMKIELKSGSITDIENELIEDFISKTEFEKFNTNSKKDFVNNLIHNLAIEKVDGEKETDYKNRLNNEIEKMIKDNNNL
jgi:DNA repair protein SbcD/Mre11